jgi:Na+-transporting methylmalonyl-CoA/oxaloacetate decarboxylase gamma subunit
MQPVVPAGPALALGFPLGLVAAVVATLGMGQVMARLPEGGTPPISDAGVLTESHPSDAPGRLASVVHYLAGGLTGPLFVWLLYAGEYLAGPGVVTTLGVAVVLLVLMIGFFVAVVLPRSRVRNSRRGSIARDWALSAVAYLVVLVPVVAIGSELL